MEMGLWRDVDECRELNRKRVVEEEAVEKRITDEQTTEEQTTEKQTTEEQASEEQTTKERTCILSKTWAELDSDFWWCCYNFLCEHRLPAVGHPSFESPCVEPADPAGRE